VAIAATLHGTETFDQADGYTIILTPSQFLHPEQEDGAETSVQLRPSKSHINWQNDGLQHFLVFQMADT